MNGFDMKTGSVDELRTLFTSYTISASKEGRLDVLKYLVEEVGVKCGDEPGMNITKHAPCWLRKKAIWTS